VALPAFEKLTVWRKAPELALCAYELTESFPASERFALRDQVRRAAVAVPSNIAEGHGRQSETEFAYFLRVALGSLSELQALMLLARDLGYVDATKLQGFWNQSAELSRALQALLGRVAP
jgi:four helix bundle protein